MTKMKNLATALMVALIMSIVVMPGMNVLAEEFHEEFNGDNTTLTQNGWTIDGKVTLEFKSEADGSSNKFLKINRNATLYGFALVKTLATPMTGRIFYEMRFKVDNTVNIKNYSSLFEIHDSTSTASVVDGQKLIMSAMMHEGSLYIHKNGTNSTTSIPYTDGWNTIKVLLDTDYKMYDLWLNGVKKISANPYYLHTDSNPNPATNFGKIVFAGNNIAEAYSYMIDDVKVYKDKDFISLYEDFSVEKYSDLTTFRAISVGGGTEIVDVVGEPGNKALKTRQGNNSKYAFDAAFMPLKGTVKFEMRFMFNKAFTGAYPYIATIKDSSSVADGIDNSTGTNIMHAMFNGDKLQPHNNISATKVGDTLAANIYHTMVVEVDTDTKKYSVWLNGKSVAKDFTFYSNNSANDVGKVAIAWNLPSTTDDQLYFYYDYIKVYKEKNESTDESFVVQPPEYSQSGADVKISQTIINKNGVEKSVSIVAAECKPSGEIVNVDISTKTIEPSEIKTFEVKIENVASEPENKVKIFVFQDISTLRPIADVKIEGKADFINSYFVSEEGSDNYSGQYAAVVTLQDGKTDGPFRTIARAQQAVRSDIVGGMTNDKTVYIREGKYFLA